MNIREQVFSKLNKKSIETQVSEWHHILMRAYGWIPLEEFKKLPMQTVNELFKQMNDEARKTKGRK
jgi:hypothetical protein